MCNAIWLFNNLSSEIIWITIMYWLISVKLYVFDLWSDLLNCMCLTIDLTYLTACVWPLAWPTYLHGFWNYGWEDNAGWVTQLDCWCEEDRLEMFGMARCLGHAHHLAKYTHQTNIIVQSYQHNYYFFFFFFPLATHIELSQLFTIIMNMTPKHQNKHVLVNMQPVTSQMYFHNDIIIEFLFISTDDLVAHFLTRIWPIWNQHVYVWVFIFIYKLALLYNHTC